MKDDYRPLDWSEVRADRGLRYQSLYQYQLMQEAHLAAALRRYEHEHNKWYRRLWRALRGVQV